MRIYFYFFLFTVSFLLTLFIRKVAIKKSVLDIPNERSSHLIPTPRGGGLAIILTIYLGVGLLMFFEQISVRISMAIFCSLPIAIISFLDDLLNVSFKIRIGIQFVCAAMVVFLLGEGAQIDFIYFLLSGWWLSLIFVFVIVWMTNLFNFLDGIDGYAGSQSVYAGIAMYLLFDNPAGLVIAIASLAFLFFNWQPAKIFMGDVGSATLGFIFAVILLMDLSGGKIYQWLIIFSVFWFDATITLLRRLLGKEPLNIAHKKHAYQRLVQTGWSHQKVVLSSIIFNASFLIMLVVINQKYIFLFFCINLILLSLIYFLIEIKRPFDYRQK